MNKAQRKPAMAKQQKKQSTKKAKSPRKFVAREEPIPPGATRKALDRPLDPGGGPAGSASGPRHAADDIGTENEEYEAEDTTRTLASPPVAEEDPLEKGPPFAGVSGGAVGGTPAQLRSAEEFRRESPAAREESATAAASLPPPSLPPNDEELDQLRLTGFEPSNMRKNKTCS